MSTLDKVRRRQLQRLAHSLKPVVRLGQHGLTDAVVRELDLALEHHELVKIKLAGADRAARAELIDTLVTRSHAQLVQSIGATAVLFRRNHSDPVISFESF